ncbi:unnamed protein product, partial [Prorocentrum cordatum]
MDDEELGVGVVHRRSLTARGHRDGGPMSAAASLASAVGHVSSLTPPFRGRRSITPRSPGRADGRRASSSRRGSFGLTSPRAHLVDGSPRARAGRPYGAGFFAEDVAPEFGKVPRVLPSFQEVKGKVAKNWGAMQRNIIRR